MLVKSNLCQLRLPTMNAEFDNPAWEAAESSQTFQDYLLRLAELTESTSGGQAQLIGVIRMNARDHQNRAQP